MQQHEQRAAERIRSFLRAQIIFNNRLTTIECIIKNYSASGAKIAINDTLTVPTEFDLYIPAKQRGHHARLVWRDKDSIGVNFIDAGVAAERPTVSALDGSAARLRELELQNAELKQRIRALSKRLEDLGQDPTLAA
ncbi:MAG: PilZ domain-containing protein [Pseudomonadota bacterium]